MAGKKGRSGKPPAARMENIQELLAKYFTPEARQKVLATVIEMAQSKNLEAVKLLWAYSYGKPLESMQHLGGVTVKVVYGNGDK